MVEQLIAAGAKLDVQNSNGYGPCGDCIGRKLPKLETDFSAGSLRSSRPRRTATRSWSSSSSPPAPPSTSKKTTGRDVGPSELALRYQNRNLTGLLGRLTALIWAAYNGQTHVVEQLIAAGAKLDVQESKG